VTRSWDAGVARFFGIIIRMFAEPAAPHHRPRFHAYYQDEVGIFAIDTIELIGGSLHQQQRRLVERGPKSISLSCSQPGIDSRQVGRPERSSRFDR
jgi:hypothetical protein